MQSITNQGLKYVSIDWKTVSFFALLLLLFSSIVQKIYAQGTEGTLKWSYTIGGSVHSSPAVGTDGTIYVGSYSSDNKLYAITPAGTLKWSYTTGGPIASSSTIGSDGTIYVGSYAPDNKLYAITPAGALKWSYTTGGNVQSSPAVGADGTIYIGSKDSKVYALTSTGTLKWSYTTGGEVPSSPAIGTDGTIYIGSKDSKVYALTSTGTLKWSYTTGGEVPSSPAIGTDGTIYIGSQDGKLYAVTPTGTLKWSYTIGNLVRSSPAVGSDGTIYVGSDDTKLYAVTPTGAFKWSYITGGVVYSSPAIGSDGTIYIGSGDSKLYAITSTGTLKWSYTTGDQVYSSPAVGSDGTIYVGSYDDKLYVLASSSTGGLASSPWPMFHHDNQHTGNYETINTSPTAIDSFLVLIPDTLLVNQKKFPGDTITLPIYVNSSMYNQHNGIYSFQTKITYKDSLFQCIGYDSSGTVLSNRGGLTEFTVQFRKDSGRSASLDTLRIAGASDDSLYYPEVPGTPFAFPRPLIKLKFRIHPNISHVDSTPLHFVRFMFNEGIPKTSTKDGSIKIWRGRMGDVDKNGAIQPYDAVLVLRYVVQDTTLDAESQIAAEVSNNGEITAYDASLILQYFVGRITTFPAGSYYKQALLSNKGADIVMEWGEVKDGMVSLLVKAKNLSEVYGYSLALSYDPGVLTYQGYQSSDLTKRMTAVVRNDGGQLRMAVAGVEALNGDGEIVAFEFKLNSNGNLNRDKLVNLNELVLNEEIIISNVMMSSLPKTHSLEQNYPNPFNPETRIRYQILEARQVQLIVYNLLGQPVRTLVNEMKPAGVYEVRWDGKNDQGISLASGVYIYRIKAGSFVSTRKLILMK